MSALMPRSLFVAAQRAVVVGVLLMAAVACPGGGDLTASESAYCQTVAQAEMADIASLNWLTEHPLPTPATEADVAPMELVALSRAAVERWEEVADVALPPVEEAAQSLAASRRYHFDAWEAVGFATYWVTGGASEETLAGAPLTLDEAEQAQAKVRGVADQLCPDRTPAATATSTPTAATGTHTPAVDAPLSIDDLPDGWRAFEPASEAALTEWIGRMCDDDVTLPQVARLPDATSSAFTDEDRRSIISHSAADATDAAATAAIDQVSEIANGGCRRPSDTSAEWALTRLPVENLGQGGAGFRVGHHFPEPDGVVTVDVIIWRRDGQISFLSVVATNDRGWSGDALYDLVSEVDDRL